MLRLPRSVPKLSDSEFWSFLLCYNAISWIILTLISSSGELTAMNTRENLFHDQIRLFFLCIIICLSEKLSMPFSGKVSIL